MKAYFVGSIKGRDKYLPYYKRIVAWLQKNSVIVFEDTLRPSESEVYSLGDQAKVDYYKQVQRWINNSDLMIAEVSYPSTGIGYEISLAISKEKPVIILSMNDDSPHFLEGIQSDKIVMANYAGDDLEEALQNSLDLANDQMDTRFNFFISPKIGNYLDWMSKKKRLPRAVYLRKLIEEDMKKNKDYEE